MCLGFKKKSKNTKNASGQEKRVPDKSTPPPPKERLPKTEENKGLDDKEQEADRTCPGAALGIAVAETPEEEGVPETPAVPKMIGPPES